MTEPPAGGGAAGNDQQGPTVTVLLTTFRPLWLEEAARSVLAQSFTDLELLVLDDENNPHTRDIVEGFDDDRVRYSASTARPLGPAGNHDRGLQQARGVFVAIINHDDVWAPELLARLHGALVSEPTAVAAFSDHDCVGEDGRPAPALTRQVRAEFGRENLRPGLHQPFRTLALVTRSVPVAQSVLWRRSAVVRIPACAYGAYDLWIAYWLSRGGAGAVYVPEVLASWRVTPGNLSSRPSLRRHLGILWVLASVILDRHMSSVRRAAARQWIQSARHAVKDLLSRGSEQRSPGTAA